MTNLRSLLIDARQFVGKSRCSRGHSVSEVLERAKPGDRHCLYCEQQAALHDRLMQAVADLPAEPPAPPCPKHESGHHWCGNCFEWLGPTQNRPTEPPAEPPPPPSPPPPPPMRIMREGISVTDGMTDEQREEMNRALR